MACFPRSEVIFDQLSLEKDSHQILFPRLPRKSRQHFIARQFFRAHKSQAAHIVQWVHRLEGASRSRIFRSALSSGPLFHSPSNIYIPLALPPECYTSTQVWSGGTITRHYSRHSGNIFPILPLTVKTRSKKLSGVWSERISAVSAASHSLSKTDFAKLWISTGGGGLSKTAPFNAACHTRLSTISLPSSPTWTGIHIISTSNPSYNRSLYICLHSLTSGWVRCDCRQCLNQWFWFLALLSTPK
jgi:hypothetical protein